MVEGDEGGRIVFVKKGKLMTSQLWRRNEGVLVEGAHSQQVVETCNRNLEDAELLKSLRSDGGWSCCFGFLSW